MRISKCMLKRLVIKMLIPISSPKAGFLIIFGAHLSPHIEQLSIGRRVPRNFEPLVSLRDDGLNWSLRFRIGCRLEPLDFQLAIQMPYVLEQRPKID